MTAKKKCARCRKARIVLLTVMAILIAQLLMTSWFSDHCTGSCQAISSGIFWPATTLSNLMGPEAEGAEGLHFTASVLLQAWLMWAILIRMVRYAFAQKA